MSTYTIVKTYKVYRGPAVSGEPLEELDGWHLRGWLKDQGYPYKKIEEILKQLDDQGSLRLQALKNLTPETSSCQ